MNEQEVREILDAATRRDHVLYTWLRWLILLAAGSLTVLVSFRPLPRTAA